MERIFEFEWVPPKYVANKKMTDEEMRRRSEDEGVWLVESKYEQGRRMNYNEKTVEVIVNVDFQERQRLP